MSDAAPRPIAAVGVVCLRGSEVLLVKRGKPPRAGEWSLPGGRIEFMEKTSAAALRELKEETGVEADLLGLVEVVDGIFPATATTPGRHFVLIDYAARWRAGEASAGDDASEARFVPLDAVEELVAWSETRRIIARAAAMARAAEG